MFMKNGRVCIKIKAYEYIEIAEKRIRFGALRGDMNNLLGESSNINKEDFCEILGDIRLEFCSGRFSAAVVPEGYNLCVNRLFLGYSLVQVEYHLEKIFSPVLKLSKKGSICCKRVGLICFDRSRDSRIFVCCRDYYNQYSTMLLLMEQCEQKTSVNDV